MKNTVLVVGEKFRYSDDFLEYLKRRIREKLTKIDAFLFIKDNDPNILVEFENYISKSSNIIIAASKNNFALIGKMLSTHMSDTLVPRGNMLIPSKCKTYIEGSYTVTISGKPINVIRIETNEDIPQILIEERVKLKKAFILGENEESVRVLLSPVAQASDISVNIFENSGGYTEIISEEKKYGKLENFTGRIGKLFGQKAIVADSPEEYIIDTLRERGEKIAVAESCSGGLLSYKFVHIPGASDVFVGSLTTYANEAKTSWLGVENSIIEEYGAVSEQTIAEMLDGVLKISGADYAAAISGVAGPGGGSDEKPVGCVYIGAKHRSGVQKIEKKNFKGDRSLIQSSAAAYSLKIICEILKDFSKTS